mmetsp:Transcript_3821/g.6877  ORF Transcript_3821/g.6877 Transcript_3821/m.6877 type:complete len:268 (-) Transcript_3821:724-1527(-)
MSRAQRGFHHTSSSAKQHTSTTSVTQWVVKRLVFKRSKVDLGPGSLDQTSKLSSCQHIIHFRHACTVNHQFRAGSLVLLGHTRHHTHQLDFRWVSSNLLSKIGLCNGCKHVLRALAAAQVGNKLGVYLFDQIDPGRAARSEHGEWPTLADTGHQLCSFLHNGQIGTKVGIKHVVKPKRFERSHQLACAHAAWRESKRFRQSDAHGRRSLHHSNILAQINFAGRILSIHLDLLQAVIIDIIDQQLFNCLDTILFNNGGYWAAGDACST